MRRMYFFASALLVSMAAMSFVSCGDDDDDDNDDPKKEVADDNGSNGKNESTQLPKGWKDTWMGYCNYGDWDESFMPSVLPGPEASFKVDNSLFKDYKHDILGSIPCYGSLTWDNKSDYRMWSILFATTEADLATYVEKVKAAGFQGYESTWNEYDDGDKIYRFCHSDGWFLQLYANVPYSKKDGVDYNVSLDITDCIVKRQSSICGMPLPTAGLPLTSKDKAVYTIYDADGGETTEKVDWNGSFISTEGRYWEIKLGYECFLADNAKAYVETLKNAGWKVESEPSEEGLSDGYYQYRLSKDGVSILLYVERCSLDLIIVSNKAMLENY